MEVQSFIISGTVLIAIIGWFLKYYVSNLDKKFDLIFKKLDELAKQSDINDIYIQLEKLENRIRQVEDKQNKCKSCNV